MAKIKQFEASTNIFGAYKKKLGVIVFQHFHLDRFRNDGCIDNTSRPGCVESLSQAKVRVPLSAEE